MAVTRLTDVIDVDVFNDIAAVGNPELTALLESGIITQNNDLNALAGAPSPTVEMPFWNDLDPDDEPNIGTDNPADIATPGNVDQGKQIARKAMLNNSWGAASLVALLSMGADPMDVIRNRIDTYWMRQFQRRLIASANGILADNIANDGGDMVFDVASESIAGQSDTTKFNSDNFVEAAYTLGDHVENVTAIGVHSMVAKQITKTNDAEDVRDSEGRLLYQTYKNRRIIVDDTLPVVAGGTDGFKYTSVLYGAGAFGYGETASDTPFEIQRDPDQGNGAGVDTLWSRKVWLLHAAGFQFTSASVASLSATLAELANAANWDRVVDRKNVPLAFLITN